LQFLLQNKADVHAVDKSRRSGLHIAALGGKAKALAVLIEAGLQVDMRDSNNCTALHFAVSANQVQTVQVLLSHKADAGAKDWAGRSALHLAAAIGAKGCAALLLASGAAVDVLDDDRCTPLHHAAFNGHAEMVQVAERISFLFVFFKNCSARCCCNKRVILKLWILLIWMLLPSRASKGTKRWLNNCCMMQNIVV
jgi:ankyrin repeat protein